MSAYAESGAGRKRRPGDKRKCLTSGTSITSSPQAPTCSRATPSPPCSGTPWPSAAEAVREIAGGLMSLGFAPGECASILSNTNIEWVLADLAVLSCGGVANGIYPTDAAAQVHYLGKVSRAAVLFGEGDEPLGGAGVFAQV